MRKKGKAKGGSNPYVLDEAEEMSGSESEGEAQLSAVPKEGKLSSEWSDGEFKAIKKKIRALDLKAPVKFGKNNAFGLLEEVCVLPQTKASVKFLDKANDDFKKVVDVLGKNLILSIQVLGEKKFKKFSNVALFGLGSGAT